MSGVIMSFEVMTSQERILGRKVAITEKHEYCNLQLINMPIKPYKLKPILGHVS